MIAKARRVPLAALGTIILVAAGLLLVADIKRGAAANRLFFEGYESLWRGMSRSEVDRLLLAPASYVCNYRSYRVHYYRRQDRSLLGLLLSTSVPENLPKEVADVSSLPNIYAAVQVAFSGDDRLVAFTWNGESTQVTAANGTRVPGSHLGILDAELQPRSRGGEL